MLTAAIISSALFLAIAVPAAAIVWLLRVHRELVLLAYAVHRAEQAGEPETIALAEDALSQRLMSVPAGLVGRFMGISAPRSPDTPTQAR